MKKRDLNPHIHLSEGNIKSKCTDEITFITWSLPSKIACPYSTEKCRNRCFAKKNENFDNVRASRMENFEETKKETFINDMILHLQYHLDKSKNKNKKIFVRIHTSGDFYDYEYFKKWVNIAQSFKDNNRILFQSYTKSMPILQEYLQQFSTKNLNEYNKILNDTNIHFIWSIWEDTCEDYTLFAKNIDMQTFIALPNQQIKEAVNNGSFLCNGDCGVCRECYTGKSKQIVIPIH